MKKTIKELLYAFLVGVGIGTLTECAFSILTGQMIVGIPSFIASHDPVFVKLIQTLLYGGFGVVGVGAVKLFEYVFKGKIFLLLTLHILTLLAYFSLVGWYLEWFRFNTRYLFSLLIFIVIYLCVWAAIYFSERKRIQQINEKISLRNKES